MNPSNIIAYVFVVIQAIEQLAAAIPAVVNIAKNLRITLTAMQDEKRDPSAEEWAAINAQIAEALAMLTP